MRLLYNKYICFSPLVSNASYLWLTPRLLTSACCCCCCCAKRSTACDTPEKSYCHKQIAHFEAISCGGCFVVLLVLSLLFVCAFSFFLFWKKKRLAAESLAYNCKTPAFRKLFPELVELHERRKADALAQWREVRELLFVDSHIGSRSNSGPWSQPRHIRCSGGNLIYTPIN